MLMKRGKEGKNKMAMGIFRSQLSSHNIIHNSMESHDLAIIDRPTLHNRRIGEIIERMPIEEIEH